MLGYQYRLFDSVQLLLNGTAIRLWQSCGTEIHTISNVSHSDEGEYACKAQAADGTTFETPLGNLSVIGK